MGTNHFKEYVVLCIESFGIHTNFYIDSAMVLGFNGINVDKRSSPTTEWPR
jgi:hypothetical protein